MQVQERPRRAPKSNGHEAGDEATLDLRKLLRALQAVRDGDFSVRLPSDQTGLAGKIADTFNEIVNSNQRLARELERAGQIVGKDGRPGIACRSTGAPVPGAAWRRPSTH